jgi:hypothetical protein
MRGMLVESLASLVVRCRQGPKRSSSIAFVQPQRAQRRSALPQALLKARRATRGCHASSTAHSSSADARECATSTGVTNGAEAFFPNG